MTRRIRYSTIAAAWIACSLVAFAAKNAAPRYDRTAEKTLHGTILHAVGTPDERGVVMVDLDLETPDGVIVVKVGPAGYIGEQNFFFFAGDAVDVTGAAATLDGQPVILARTVTKSGKTLTLRSEDGAPLWGVRATTQS